MLLVGTAVVVLIALIAILRMGLPRVRASVTVIAFGLALPALALVAPTVNAAAVASVPLGAAAGYSVLGGQTVTNTGPSVLASSVGLSPGTEVTGFPPGTVAPPATIDKANPAADLAQADLTTAYNDAAGRPATTTKSADLAGLNLSPGVYSSPTLELTGTLTLDAEGDPDAVFIFQAGSTLTTGSSSSVALINGAQVCNVFWQVGSSATLGSGSTFVGTVLALTSVTVETAATVHGRVLARNGSVTLDSDIFTAASCAQTGSTTTTGSGSTSTSSIAVGPTTTTAGSSSTTTSTPVGPTTTIPGSGSTTTSTSAAPTTTIPGSGSTTTSAPAGPTTTVGGPSTTSPQGGSTTLPPSSTVPTTTTGVPTTSGPRQTTTTVHTGLLTQTQSSGPSGGTSSTGTTGQLARTGWPTLPLLIFGGLMVTCGLVTLLVGRDRNFRR